MRGIGELTKLRIQIDGYSQLIQKIGFKPGGILKPKEFVPVDRLNEIYLSIKEAFKSNSNPLLLITDDLTFEPFPYSSNIEKSFNSLILAKAWVGKLMGELGKPSPYYNDGRRKEVEDIESATDKAKLKLETESHPMTIDFGNGEESIQMCFQNKNQIEKIDWIRERINDLILTLNGYIGNIIGDLNPNSPFYKYQERKINKIYDNIEQHLTEARFWLGFELGRIKEMHNETK